MKASYHFAATVAVSGILYFVFHSLSCVLISFASGFLIDVDHLIDYYRITGFNCKVKQFFYYCNTHKLEYLSIYFHSIEFLIMLWIAIYVMKSGQFWISLAIGFSQHMIFDLIFNRTDLKTHYFYFLTIRALNGFNVDKFRHLKKKQKLR